MEQVVVVIPTLNEAKNISQAIQSVQVQGGNPVVCVVDGGSNDDTVEQAKRAGAKVLSSPHKGRGLQMNLGWRSEAQDSTRAWFLFLHGDSVLPEGYKAALEAVMNAQQQAQTHPHVQASQQTLKQPADGGVLGQPEPTVFSSGGDSRAGHSQGLGSGLQAASGAETRGSMYVHDTRAQRRRRGHPSTPVDEHHQQLQPTQQQQQQPQQHQWLMPWHWFGAWRGRSQPSSQFYSRPLWPSSSGFRCCHNQPQWGCFRTMRTELQGTLRGSILSGGVMLRTTLLGMPYGDQGIFVHRSALEKLGGFQEWPLLEDVDMVQRLKRDVSDPAILPLDMRTSGRRWLNNGFWRNAAFNQVILGAWALGFDPHTLASWYYRPRQ